MHSVAARHQLNAAMDLPIHGMYLACVGGTEATGRCALFQIPPLFGECCPVHLILIGLSHPYDHNDSDKQKLPPPLNWSLYLLLSGKGIDWCAPAQRGVSSGVSSGGPRRTVQQQQQHNPPPFFFLRYMHTGPPTSQPAPLSLSPLSPPFPLLIVSPVPPPLALSYHSW